MSFLILLTACLTELPVDPTDPTDLPVTPTGDIGLPTEGTFGPEGGTVLFDGGITLEVPAGALTEEVVISVVCVPEGPDGYDLLSDHCTFAPEGLTFATPVTLSIPMQESGVDPRSFWGSDAAWSQLEATFGNGLAEVSLDQLASVFVAENGPVREVVDVGSRAADILMVVDDSCSMEEEQLRLGSGFPALLGHLAGTAVDWRIGVTTTDMEGGASSGRLRTTTQQGLDLRWVDDATPVAGDAYTALVTAGTNGSASEAGRAAAHAVLDSMAAEPENAGFQRAGDLHLVFVSDEDDGSVTPGRGVFQNWLTTARPGAVVQAHAITGLDTSTCAAVFENAAEYHRYANNTGGGLYDLCASDFTPHLLDIAERVSLPVRTLPVAGDVDPATLVVSLHEPGTGTTTVLGTDEWSWDPNEATVILADVPLAGDQVWIDYTPL